MGRYVDPLVFGPPGICSSETCRRSCCTLDQVGIRCYHCHEGVFIHRREWTFTKCPDCQGVFSALCSSCKHEGCIATPRAPAG